MTIDETIEVLKRIFGNYELDLPCTDSLNTLSATITFLNELKELRKCVNSSEFKDGYNKAIDDCINIVRTVTGRGYRDIDGDWVEPLCNTKDLLKKLKQLKVGGIDGTS